MRVKQIVSPKHRVYGKISIYVFHLNARSEYSFSNYSLKSKQKRSCVRDAPVSAVWYDKVEIGVNDEDIRKEKCLYHAKQGKLRKEGELIDQMIRGQNVLYWPNMRTLRTNFH